MNKFNPLRVIAMSLLMVSFIVLVILFRKPMPTSSSETYVLSCILLNYFLFLIIISLVFYVIIKIANQYRSLKIEPISVLSFMALFLNYMVLEYLSRFRGGSIGLPAVGRGDSELLSFLGGFLAVFLGHVAILKIKRNKCKGKKLAIIGLVGGYLCMGFWIGLVVVFAIGMSSF